MNRFPLDAREVRRTCDFLAIASRYTRLRRVGAQYRGLCPFHRESHPSLYIEPQKQIWKCFGCDRGGDVFAFVMLAEDCGFSEALQIAAGVARESEPRSGERFRARVGASEASPSAREAGGSNRQRERDSILASLDATENRNAIIARANGESFIEFERACEPRSSDPLLVNKRTTGHE
ncbi:MAG TPA: CHC2 zinc finger domain-containing protein [Candidatus Dormibacteraeota bacterium]|nr:CHC2 zinc finger domain-containing protein [Candidatus Dormibacteraeota bacterium]